MQRRPFGLPYVEAEDGRVVARRERADRHLAARAAIGRDQRARVRRIERVLDHERHAALTQQPRPWTRWITPDHAKAIAATGGVIGVWPVAQVANIDSYAANILRMVDAVGVDHVGIGTDQMGLTGPSCLPSYADLPLLAEALKARLTAAEIAKVLGGNYRRVFEASLA